MDKLSIIAHLLDRDSLSIVRSFLLPTRLSTQIRFQLVLAEIVMIRSQPIFARTPSSIAERSREIAEFYPDGEMTFPAAKRFIKNMKQYIPFPNSTLFSP